MGLVEVSRQPLHVVHRASWCSCALLVQLVFFGVTVIAPFLIAYGTQGAIDTHRCTHA
jgi:hypothetical protein